MVDQAIIALFEQRDEQAISESEKQYGALCRSVARDITGSDEDAEECLNDAMLAAWNAIPPAKPKNFCAYLLRLVRNAAYNRYNAAHTQKRSTANIAGSVDELAEIIPDRGDIISEVERRETVAAINAFLKGLPQKQRDLFVRRYWYAADTAALAKMFHMTESHVRMTLSRLRKRLQKHLQKEGLL